MNKKKISNLFPCPFRKLDHWLINAINHAFKCEIGLPISWEIVIEFVKDICNRLFSTQASIVKIHKGVKEKKDNILVTFLKSSQHSKELL